MVNHIKSISTNNEKLHSAWGEAFNIMPLPAFIMDSENLKFVAANLMAVEHSGYSKEELEQMGPADLNPAFTQESLRYFLSTALDGKSIKAETLHQHKDGTCHEVELSLTPFSQDKFSYVLAIVKKIKTPLTHENKESVLSFYNRYKFIVETAQVGIWQVDENYITVFVNEYLATLLGFSKEEMVGKKASDFIPREELGDAERLALERSKGLNDQYEKLFFNKKNEKVYFFVQPTVITENGIFKGSIATLINITESKIKEEKAILKDRWFKALVENSNDAICLLSAEGIPQYISPSINKISGFSDEDFLGNEIDWDNFYPGDEKVFKNSFEDVLQNPNYTTTVTYRHKNNFGSYVWIEAQMTNLLHEKGINGIVLNFREITQRKEAEFKLKESEERYKTAEILSKLGHWERDLETNVLTWSDNLYNIFEIDRNSIVTLKNVISKIHPEDQNLFQNAVSNLDKGKNLDIIYRIITPNDSIKYLHEVGFITYNEAKVSVKVSGFSQDVTEQIQTELKLKKEQERYHFAESQGNLGHWEWDMLSNEIIWSPQLYKIFGVPLREKITFDIFLNTVHPEDREEVKGLIDLYISSGKSYDVVHRINKSDGSISYIREVAHVIKDENNKTLKLAGISQDVTDRIITAKQIKNSEEKYKLLFDKSPVPMMMVEQDTLQIIQVNEAALDQYGYSKKEFLKMNLNDIRFPNEDYAKGNNNKILEQSKPLNRVKKHKIKGGKEIYVRVSTIKTQYQGKKIILKVALNVDFEVKFEKQLKHSQEQLGTIFNNILNPMWLLDVENNNQFRYVAVNEAFNFHSGYNKNYILGKITDEANYFGTYPHFKNKYIEVREEKQTIYFTVTINLKSGSRIIDVTITPIVNEQGTVQQLLCSAIDITEKKNFENELIEKNTQLRELTSYLHKIREDERKHVAREIHDELGQQLSAIKMDIAWVKKHQPHQTEDRLTDALELIDETINTVRKISSQLRPSILDDLGLQEAIESHGMEFQKRTGIQFLLNANLESKVLPNEIATTLFRIFQESLTNVSRHANASSVKCLLNVDESEVRLEIEDNGVGFNVSKSKNKKTMGLLGMKERVMMMNGTYSLESAINLGTKISITIPLA